MVSETLIRAILFVIAFALLNRARGSCFWDYLDSTTLDRVSSTFLMAVCVCLFSHEMIYSLLWSWATLFIWSVFAWDKYWAAAIGHDFDPSAKAFSPVDWLMKKQPWFVPVYQGTAGDFRRRFWGAVAMGLRQGLASVCIVGLSVINGHLEGAGYALGTLLFGFVYLVCGYVAKPYVIGTSEYIVGGLLGYIIYSTLH